MFLKCGMGGNGFTSKLYGPTMLVTLDLQIVGTIKCSRDNDDLPDDKVQTSLQFQSQVAIRCID